MLRTFAAFSALSVWALSGMAACAGELPLDRVHVEHSADRKVVSYGAGAVELRLPAGWHVWEAARGREVLLILSPAPPNLLGELPDDGVWLTYHVSPLQAADELAARADLDEMLARRVRLVAGDLATLGRRTPLTIGPWPAVKQEFSIAPADDRGSAAGARAGYHILVRTAWGICELHAVSPAAWFDQRAEQFDRIVAELTLRNPSPPLQLLDDDVRDAAPIVGAWRSFRSRVKLSGDGRIEIIPDKLVTVPVAVRTPVGESNESGTTPAKKTPPLTGRFTAQGDVLVVRWDDGSRQNYRWKLIAEELLLTDHDGQISQLRRVLE